MRHLELLSKDQEKTAFKNVRNLIITIVAIYIIIFLSKISKPLTLLVVFPVAFFIPYIIQIGIDIITILVNFYYRYIVFRVFINVLKQHDWKFVNTHETNDLINFYSNLEDIFKKNGLEYFYTGKRAVFCRNDVYVGIQEFAQHRYRSITIYRYKIFALSKIELLNLKVFSDKEPFLNYNLYQIDKNIKNNFRELNDILQSINLNKNSRTMDHS